jgi:hypothetical protein
MKNFGTYVEFEEGEKVDWDKVPVTQIKIKIIRMLDLLKYLRDTVGCCPCSIRANPDRTNNCLPSNGELKGWIRDKAIIVNGKKPNKEDTPIVLPIWELVFFPNGKRKTTIVGSYEN